jgi:mRNA interferase MazF
VVIQRGEIWWAELPVPQGSEAGYRRPVLVVQSDYFNASRLATTIVAPLTTNERLASMPGNVRLFADDSGLTEVSVVQVSALLTIDRRFLRSRVKRLSGRIMALVDRGVALVLDL